MSKEMIISVNGREKKIAILENGQVSEFYIERDEDNSGVVGNIYKGRVQRVLPGMQSAFVDIGLERDAFLYVSDFFDEQEEIERIVMEKSKDKKSADELERETTDELHKGRLKRDKKIDDTQEKAEIAGGSDSSNDDESKPGKKKPTRKRSTRGKKKDEVDKKDKKEDKKPAEKKAKQTRGRKKKDDEEKSKQKPKPKSKSKTSKKKENVLDISDLKIEEDSSFKRIVDEDEGTSEMLKDAMMQEAITDKVRSIEFNMESTDSAEVGSFIDALSDAGSGFERIADEDEVETPVKKPSKRKTTKSSGSRKKKSDKDDEKGKKETKPKSTRGKTSARKKTATSRKADDDKNEKAESLKIELEEDTKPATKRKSSRGKKAATKDEKTDDTDSTSKPNEVKDGEASVTDILDISEMAVRRGSRGGRSGGRRRNTSPGKKPASTDTHKDKGYKTTEAEQSITADDAIASAEFTTKKPRGGRGRGRGRQNKPQPKITDLLREGQEILVQIAKEPIAKKGARITSHIALPGRFLVYMPTIEHLGVSRKIGSSKERSRLRSLLQKVMSKEDIPTGGFIVRTAGTGKTEMELREDARYLSKTWNEVKKGAEKSKSPKLIHQDLDIIQRLLRDQLSDDFTAIRVDSEEEYLRIIEFINRIQPKLVKRVKFHTLDESILDTYGVSDEIDKALRHRVWLKSGGYLVINQTEALIAIDVNTGKFVGKGNARLEDTITKTNMEAVQEISRQIRLRDLGGIIVLDLIDMEDRNNRKKVLEALQKHLTKDKSPTKVLSFNDFGLVIMTRKRVKQSLERTLCSPCSYCDGAGWVKSAQTICFEILEEARRLSKGVSDVRQTTLRVHPEVAKALQNGEREIFNEIEDHLGVVDVSGDKSIHQEQYDFAFI